MSLDVRMTVNGEAVAESVEPRTTLVDFLRETLGLTGSHVGCEHGVCGACTVRVDDVIVRGCLTLAVQCDGARVETIEGVSDSGDIADLQDAFRRRNALQCGFCTPAMLLTAQELLARRRRPEPRSDSRASRGQLLPLHRLSGDRRRDRVRRAISRQRKTDMNQHTKPQSIAQRADELEEEMMHELERVVTKSTLHYLADGEIKMDTSAAAWAKNPKAIFNMGADPRLPPMPEKPTLIDYFRCRFASHAHLLQSATHALKAGHNEKVILACLLHDIGVVSFIRCDHGYWGAQMIEPYVDEEVSWAVRTHQALRFFPDEAAGYKYPEMYVKLFGDDYKPEPYIVAEYERARNHKWYMTSRLICVNDIYSFDPNAKVNLDDFVDIIGRNFRQPEEGLGLDDSRSAHMWRTMMWPNRFL